jgi:hypothetical protein
MEMKGTLVPYILLPRSVDDSEKSIEGVNGLGVSEGRSFRILIGIKELKDRWGGELR